MNDQRFDEEMLARELRSLAAEMEQLSAPPELETKLREAFRVRRVVVPLARKRAISRYWWAAAVAAMLLIALSVIAIRWRSEGVNDPRQAQAQPAPQNPKQVKDVEYRAQSVSTGGHAGPPLQTPNHKHVRSAVLRRPQSTEVANHVTREIATDFIPLSYMNVASLQDGGQIVRVELPRSALVNFGLPVNMDRYNEKVKADVLLGVDGLAHAIRFVQ
jgi:hypothetical protein